MNEDLEGAIKEYVSSVRSDQKILDADITGTQAHILMLYKTGIVAKADAVKILAALGQLKGQGYGEGAAGAEDGHELLEACVSRISGADSGGHIQTARSRNDQVALATRIKLREDTHHIQDRILHLASVLLDRAQENCDTIIPLYTHLQHAQAGILSHYFTAQADVLIRDHGRFSDMYGRLNANPLGAGPVGGSSLPIDRDITTRMLAFPDMVENSLDATGSRDYMAEFASCVAIMMVNLSRMAEDMVIWCSDEFGFLELADGSASPSSAMPQKKNPDVLELTRGKAARAIGDLVAILAAQKGLASGYGRDLQETKEPAWSAAETAIGALDVMAEAISGMKVNAERMARAAESGYVTSLDVAEGLVSRGVPFRQAHMEVGRLVGAAHAAGKSLKDMTESDMGQICSINPKKMAAALAESTIPQSLRRRASRGGASISQQHSMIRRRRDALERLGESSAARREAASTTQMYQEIDRLLDAQDGS